MPITQAWFMVEFLFLEGKLPSDLKMDNTPNKKNETTCKHPNYWTWQELITKE